MRQTVKLIGYGVEGNFKIVDILYKKWRFILYG
mgnify:CR=1 FL=1